jgi:hypothetical protein
MSTGRKLPVAGIDPGILRNPLGLVEAKESPAKAEGIRILEEALSQWEAFDKSERGRVARELAEARIKQLDYQLSKSALDLIRESYIVDLHSELRAEWRGERRVWVQILHEPQRLKAQLNQLREGEKPTDGKEGWATRKSGGKET